ncbi:hypothetical protein NQZ68_035622 [Dissostichus eleginoides]|nr:hypothetical protein NQZ68_035622 [Dissostichus eleginoides]
MAGTVCETFYVWLVLWCVPVYQRSSVRVLTRFTAQDSLGRTTYLLGSSDWFVDVTELVRNWLRVEDPRVASLDSNNNLIGLRPGKTSLHVISEQWDGMLGGCDITVTSEPVTPGDLSVQVVSGIGMSVADSPTHPSIVTTTVTAFNILYNHHQVHEDRPHIWKLNSPWNSAAWSSSAPRLVSSPTWKRDAEGGVRGGRRGGNVEVSGLG